MAQHPWLGPLAANRLYTAWKETGDPHYRDRLIEGFRPLAACVSQRVQCAPQQRDDMLSEAYIALIRGVDSYKAERHTKIQGYLTTVMLRRLWHFANRGFEQADVLSLDTPCGENGEETVGEVSLVADDDPTWEVLRREFRAEFEAALDDERISPTMREIIRARYFRGEDEQEIARRLGIKHRSVGTLRCEAFRRLRPLLRERGVDLPPRRQLKTHVAFSWSFPPGAPT